MNSSKKKMKDLVLVLQMAIDRDDLKMIEMLIPELHIKLTNYVKYGDITKNPKWDTKLK